jgi:hypothetical protein
MILQQQSHNSLTIMASNIIKCDDDCKDDCRDCRQKCVKCDEIKVLGRFRHKRRKCIECERQQCREYKRKNKEKIAEYNSAYKQEHKQDVLEYQRQYWKDHKHELMPKANKRLKKRRKTDKNFQLSTNLRTRIGKFICGKNKSASTQNLLGCSWDQFRQWMEWQLNAFHPDLTMAEYGPRWHIDHVIPCARFSMSIIKDQERCFHWSNCQPMLGSENLSKQDFITHHSLWKHEIKVAAFLTTHKDYKLKERYDVAAYL